MESLTSQVSGSESSHILQDRGTLTFGRGDCDIRLAGDDPAVTRDAGRLVHVRGNDAEIDYIRLTNNSATGWIFGFGERGYSVSIPPKSEFVVTQQNTRYLIEGNYGIHDISVYLANNPTSKNLQDRQTPTSAASQAYSATNQSRAAAHLRNKFNEKQRLILSSVFDEFMNPAPVPLPRPKTGEAAAEKLRTDPRMRKYFSNVRDIKPIVVSEVVRLALEAAAESLVAGIDRQKQVQGGLLRGTHRALGTNKELHRLALFLLGTGIIVPGRKQPPSNDISSISNK